MKMKALFSFKDKVIEPCNKFLSSFKHKFHMPKRRSRPRGIRTRVVRFRKPFSLKSLTFPQCRPKSSKQPRLRKVPRKTRRFRAKKWAKSPGKPIPKVRIAQLLTVMFSLRKLPKEIDTDTSEQVNMADVSVSEGGIRKEPFPSPTTPGYVRHSSSSDSKKGSSSDDVEEIEDSCRSFESSLVEMIVEDGKLKDLMDVEELLYCWREIKDPIFVGLVSRFYGEVCEDLFSSSSSSSEDESESHVTSISETQTDVLLH